MRFKASEAGQIAKDNELLKIYNEIKSKAEKGNTRLVIERAVDNGNGYKYLTPYVINCLKEDGYTLTTISSRFNHLDNTYSDFEVELLQPQSRFTVISW